jgi:hypothetical protein
MSVGRPIPTGRRRVALRALVAILFCGSCSRIHEGARPAPATAEGKQAMDNNDAMGPEKTTIQWEGNDITLTVKDAKEMEAALLDYLASPAASKIDDRDYLAQSTRGGPAFIDSAGVVRISSWVLQSRRYGLVLSFRMPHPEQAPEVTAYLATVVREHDGWRVAEMSRERIRRRR